jgi:hypothetical protein
MPADEGVRHGDVFRRRDAHGSPGLAGVVREPQVAQGRPCGEAEVVAHADDGRDGAVHLRREADDQHHVAWSLEPRDGAHEDERDGAHVAHGKHQRAEHVQRGGPPRGAVGGPLDLVRHGLLATDQFVRESEDAHFLGRSGRRREPEQEALQTRRLRHGFPRLLLPPGGLAPGEQGSQAKEGQGRQQRVQPREHEGTADQLDPHPDIPHRRMDRQADALQLEAEQTQLPDVLRSLVMLQRRHSRDEPHQLPVEELVGLLGKREGQRGGGALAQGGDHAGRAAHRRGHQHPGETPVDHRVHQELGGVGQGQAGHLAEQRGADAHGHLPRVGLEPQAQEQAQGAQRLRDSRPAHRGAYRPVWPAPSSPSSPSSTNRDA